MKSFKFKTIFGFAQLFGKFRTHGSVAFYALFVLLLASQAFADQGRTYVLGQIGDKAIQEGELIDFALGPPEGFGPDVTWTVTWCSRRSGLLRGSRFSGSGRFRSGGQRRTGRQSG